MKKSLNELIQTLSQLDVDTLHSIYKFRCLNAEQIHLLHFISLLPGDKNLSETLARQRIQELLQTDLIREVEYLAGLKVYFLTPQGIEVIRHFFSMPTNVYDSQKQVVKRGYFRAAELDIFPKNINHQVHLNQFVIMALHENPNIPVRYYDEKYASQYTGIRPDGILSFPDVDIFLEMDMATESKRQLSEKWENYRQFLNSREYQYREKRILVLFIVAGTDREKERADVIKYTIYDRLLDMFDREFDFYAGTHMQLLNYLTDHLIPSFTREDPRTERLTHALTEKQGFALSDGERLSRIFPDSTFKWYMRKLNATQKILVEDGRILEFLVDDYYFCPASVISKISYIDKHNVYFEERFNRKIAYLVICETESQIRDDLKMIDLLGQSNVFFTTEKRLRNLPFHEAVFQFDLLGNVYHFASNSLQERIFEDSTDNCR